MGGENSDNRGSPAAHLASRDCEIECERPTRPDGQIALEGADNTIKFKCPTEMLLVLGFQLKSEGVAHYFSNGIHLGLFNNAYIHDAELTGRYICRA